MRRAFTDTQLAEIREALSTGASSTALAARYGVHRSTIIRLAKVARPRCSAITRAGTRCQNTANVHDLCEHHADIDIPGPRDKRAPYADEIPATCRCLPSPGIVQEGRCLTCGHSIFPPLATTSPSS